MATQPNPSGPAPNANRISIVTKSEIRYEGILYHINPQDQNITLCNVKSFGTEGRRPGDEIAPSPQVHEYIIFRGTDIKDLKVIEGGQQTQPEAPTTNTQPTQPVGQTAPKEQPRHEEKQQEQKMVQGQDDFDFQGMQEKFHQAALEHKQPEITSKSYSQKDFFDSLSTSTAEKTREAPFDRIAQKKVDKETFGSEYVDNASHRGGRGGRGGYKRGGGGNYRGGQNRRYQGGEGGQNRNYGGQNRYQNRQGQGGYNNYNQGGGRYQQGGDNNYQGGSRYQQGGDNNYQGGGRYQQGGDNNYQGGSRYQQGGDNNYQGGSRYQQGGDNYNQGGGRYQQNSGPRYYKTYQNVNQDQTQGGEDDKGFRKY